MEKIIKNEEINALVGLMFCRCIVMLGRIFFFFSSGADAGPVYMRGPEDF